MINWKKVNSNIPTNENKDYPGSPETPYIPCLVYICNPEIIRGGVAETVRWDTINKCWYKYDVDRLVWLSQPHLKITHFCDDINLPEPSVEQ